MKDSYGRDINYLRISLTENCNLRCIYCLPEDYSPQQYDEMKTLSEENVLSIINGAKEIGIKKIRLTGGEPLLRKDIVSIVSGIKKIGIDEIYITTNGTLLSEKIKSLCKAGLSGINISLDSLEEKQFKEITRGGKLSKVLEGIEKSYDFGLKVKINSVIIKGINENAIRDLAELTLKKGIDVRFIELMPVGQGRKFTRIKNQEIHDMLQEIYGFEKEYFEIKGVAKYFKLKNSLGKIGFISPINSCFCDSCNKIRITSDGNIKRCLNINGHKNIKEYLDKGVEKEIIEDILKEEILKKPEKHLFGKENDDEEMKNMNQIGG